MSDQCGADRMTEMTKLTRSLRTGWQWYWKQSERAAGTSNNVAASQTCWNIEDAHERYHI